MLVMDEAQKVEATVEQGGRHLSQRVVRFVKRRPILSLGLLAGAGALGGLEWAAGALLGLGAAAVVATPMGRELRQKLEARTRRMFEHANEAGSGDTHQPA